VCVCVGGGGGVARTKRGLLEAVFVELGIRRAETVLIAPGMVGFDGPRDFDRIASLPGGTRGRGGENFSALVAELGVRCVNVDATEAAIRGLVPTSHAARIKHRCITRVPPGGVVVPVVSCTAINTPVHGAQCFVADSCLRGTVRAIGTHVELALPERVLAVGDWTTTAPIARTASDSATVGKPEARLAVLAGGLSVRPRHRAPSSVALYRRWVCRHRAVPRSEVLEWG
jgi:hypothetical protein